MSFKVNFVICLLFLIMTNGFFVNPVLAADDWGIVLQTILKYKMNERLAVKIFPEIRFKDDAKEFYYQQYRLGLDYAAYEWLDLGVSYEYVTVKNSKGKWLDENRLVFLSGPQWKFAGLTITDNNRIEMRYFDEKSDHFRYRNELIMAKSVKLFDVKVKPYVSFEPWYDLRLDRVAFMRYEIGYSQGINKNFSYTLFFRIDDSNKGKGHWQATNFLGLKSLIKH